jgi:hypothetical protein
VIRKGESLTNTKGQIRIDFIFSLIFFTVMLFFIALLVNSSLSTGLADSNLDTMKSQSESILNILVSTGGSPDNWETLPPALVIRVGLASQPYSISAPKLNALRNNCDLMAKFGNINYRLTLSSGNTVLLSCGYGGPRVTSSSQVPVFVNGVYGRAVLEMW